MANKLCQDRTATCIEIDTGIPKRPVEVRGTEGFHLGEALLSEYDILEEVLCYLPYRDLQSVAQVSRAFGACVESALRKRLAPVCFSVGTELGRHRYNNPVCPALCLVLIDYTELKLDSYVCLHRELPFTEHVRKHMTQFLQDDVVISRCPIITLSCRAIQSTFTSDRLLNGVILPHIPNVKVSVFRIAESKLKSIASVLDAEVGEDFRVRCLLTYSLFINQKLLNGLVSEIQTRQPFVNFAFGGGFVRGIKSFNIEGNPRKYLKKRDELVCVAFSEPHDVDAQFDAYSLIVPEKAGSDAEIEPHFAELRRNFVSRKHGVAFRISCISREEEALRDIRHFRKHFPDVCMLGFAGDGEIGWNYCAGDKTVGPAKRKKFNQRKTIHCMSSVFVIVTWGKPKV